jgi:purine-nucleoside phosphorylase
VTHHSIGRATGRTHHDVAVVLGSGLNPLARSILGDCGIPYRYIEGLPDVSVVGHEGQVYSGDFAGKSVLMFAGRFHLYEGHDPSVVVRPVQLAMATGCRTIVLTNAAGAVNTELDVGAPCLISDHLNLTGANPLTGPSDDLGPRFLDMTEAYDGNLRSLARAIDTDLKEGVYAGLPGPSYETPAEVRMLAHMGADLVGMSTVLETIAARDREARVLGISVVTNLAAGLAPAPLSHEEVMVAGKKAADRLEALLRGFLERL